MEETRVKLVDGGEFEPREWLRREVLWASLMTPYPQQFENWTDGRALAQHEGNILRRDVYSTGNDTESQAQAFFNQGKNIAGTISNALAFQTEVDGIISEPVSELLEVQASTIDKVLGRVAVRQVTRPSDEKTYDQCQRFVSRALAEPNGREANLARAAYALVWLASAETYDWIKNSLQNYEGTLPVLKIYDGGRPRSGGNRVDSLQVVFNQIVQSAQYRKLVA